MASISTQASQPEIMQDVDRDDNIIATSPSVIVTATNENAMQPTDQYNEAMFPKKVVCLLSGIQITLGLIAICDTSCHFWLMKLMPGKGLLEQSWLASLLDGSQP